MSAHFLHTVRVLGEVGNERDRQDDKWGEIRDFPDGTGSPDQVANANTSRVACDIAFKLGVGTWENIFTEEVDEALAESDPQRLRVELLQVAAVAVAWAQAIDRRTA